MRKKYIKVPEMSKVLKLKSGATFRQENVSLKEDLISCHMIKIDHMRSRSRPRRLKYRRLNEAELDQKMHKAGQRGAVL